MSCGAGTGSNLPCYSPIHGYRAIGGGLDFRKSTSTGIPLTIPCGQCIGCRIDKQRDWSVRISHEARSWENSVFLTLTYSDDNLPPFGTLSLRHWQLFMKRLRKHVAPRRLRFIANGEYGTQFQRPHYHAVVYNYWSPDRVYFKSNKDRLYTSPTLEKLWGLGYVTEQDFDAAHGDYLAQHCVKRLSQERAAESLRRVCPFTGEERTVLNEFWTMSRRPGIGASYVESYESELWDHDNVIHRNREVSLPRYYSQRLKARDPERFDKLQFKRILAAREPKRKANNTPERLASREIVTKARLAIKPKRKL